MLSWSGKPRRGIWYVECVVFDCVAVVGGGSAGGLLASGYLIEGLVLVTVYVGLVGNVKY